LSNECLPALAQSEFCCCVSWFWSGDMLMKGIFLSRDGWMARFENSGERGSLWLRKLRF
jgi:hypothetical protein